MDREKSARLELINRELAKRRLRDFIDYNFEGYIFDEWHDELFQALQRIETGHLKRLIVEMPPRTGKTEIISKQFPAFILGKYPQKRIICASYGSELANKNSRESRRIVTDQKFKNIFPEFKLSDEKKESGNWETKEGGGYYSVGIGGALTGFGFDIGIIDDYVKNRVEAESPATREKTWDWFTSTFYTRKQGEDSSIIILATRWHLDDLIGMLRNHKEGDDWEVITFPALDKHDHSFFPNRFSSEYFINERANIGVRDFAALYQQDPIASMGGVFSKKDFRYFALSDFEKVDSDTRRHHLEIGIFCDPAFSTRRGSDDFVAMAIGRDRRSNELYLMDIVAAPHPPSQGRSIVVNMAWKWKQAGYHVSVVSVEDVSINKDQQVFVQSVDDLMREQGLIVPLNRFKPRVKKDDRIRFMIEPYISRNSVFFRVDDDGNNAWRKLEEQLLKFPGASHDDIIDTLAQGIEVFSDKKRHGNAEIMEKQEQLLMERQTNEKIDFQVDRYPGSTSRLIEKISSIHIQRKPSIMEVQQRILNERMEELS